MGVCTGTGDIPALASESALSGGASSVFQTRQKAKGMRPERMVREATVTRSQVTLNGRLRRMPVARMASNRVMKGKLESPLRVPPLQARS